MACITNSKYSIELNIILIHILLLNPLLLNVTAKKSYGYTKQKFKFPSLSSLKDVASKSKDGEACLTDGCKQAGTYNHYICLTNQNELLAIYVTSSIDRDVDPCDDFYNFACGGFVKGSKLSKSFLTSDSRLGNVQETVAKEIKEILEQSLDPNEPRFFQLARQFYTACMDTATIERYGLQPLRDIIDKLGGWPVVVADAWNATTFSWTTTDVESRKMGFYPKSIFELFVFNDLYNSSRTLLNVRPFSPYISSANLKRGLNNTIVKAYYQYMVEVAVLLGADKERAALEMNDVLKFEAELSHATKHIPIARRNKDNFQAIYRFEEMKKQLRFVNWEKYIRGLTEPAIHLTNKDTIILRSPVYVYNLIKLLNKTPKRVLANYFIWKIVVVLVPYLSNDIREIELKFKKEAIGKDRQSERSDECVNLISTRKGLITAVSALYVRKYFTNETRTAITPILHSIVNEASKVVQEASWIDQKSKKAALKKVAFMKQVVAFPDELLNNDVLDDYSRSLELYPDKHLQNFLNLNKFHYNYELSGLNESTNKNLWVFLSDSTGVNAYYYSLKNIFVLLAGLLQPPLFIPDWPFYAKYGSVGFIIGHEMMHAFDTVNIIFDETGSVNPLFTPKTERKYRKKIKCFTDQYNTYVDENLGLHVDGNLTINENLADNMGMKISYGAYKKWEASNEKELRLPMLRYTPEQTFWITSVGFLCGRMSIKQRVNLLLTEVHTPDTFRTRGVLSNSPNFAEAFNCKPGTRMNPVNKCSIW